VEEGIDYILWEDDSTLTLCFSAGHKLSWLTVDSDQRIVCGAEFLPEVAD
jgi:hypothetical protein